MNLLERDPHRRLLFALFEGCEILDFAGPLQSFHEANGLLSAPCYEILHCGLLPAVKTAQGMTVSELEKLPMTMPEDLILVPGYRPDRGEVPHGIVQWLRGAAKSGSRICSICNGAFALGEAGLLDHRRCTTHWKRTEELQRRFPLARVQHDRLFVEDGPIVTSAGIAAGIDMSLALIEQDHGPQLTAAVAREMVVYVRRDSTQTQGSIYLDFRNHLHPAIHRAQDYLLSHPGDRNTLADLVRITGMSERHLTRVFRQETGISVSEFRQRVRVEHARTLMHNPELTMEDIAEQCGLQDARTLRRMWKEKYGMPPGHARAGAQRAASPCKQ